MIALLTLTLHKCLLTLALKDFPDPDRFDSIALELTYPGNQDRNTSLCQLLRESHQTIMDCSRQKMCSFLRYYKVENFFEYKLGKPLKRGADGHGHFKTTSILISFRRRSL